ncbi:hypothetical protein JMJ35_006769 [Cladonia borealis]|uniref:MYND-type zinc finger protein samB n=1 Tax=Cladonia borealis TaxID=184061 RepID=A0AA39QXT3_9LECA|nr:hypothetical protein JMJ35_006769 [Cladonia borealis]
MTSLPSHIQQRSLSPAGNGLFTIKAIDAGEEVLRIERPLVAVLNQKHLTRACEWCFIWVSEGEGEAKTKLRACQGCRIVRYCSKTCQSSSWQHHHRHECKIFKKLYPNVLPNTVRILLQILQRRKSKSLPNTEWQALLNLQSHIDDFRSSSTKNADGLTTYQTIELMSQALQAYSTTEEEPLSLLQSLTATTLINALTLTTPHFDPLGLTLSPQIALLNHSCTPNTAITYSHATLSLRSLTPIPANSELTISYIDTTHPTPTRQSELQERYFFTCACPFCCENLTNGIPEDPPINSNSDDFRARSVKAIELQNEAATKSSPSEAYPLLSHALDLLSPYQPTRQPYATILHSAFLTALSLQNYPLALSHKLHEYFLIDPVHYQPDFHPGYLGKGMLVSRV